jgi:hypothetical protein
MKRYYRRRNRMKGNTKLTIEIKDDCGSFPVTETYTLGRDNTYESIEDWVDVFKKVLYLVGYHPETIKEVFNDDDRYEETPEGGK